VAGQQRDQAHASSGRCARIVSNLLLRQADYPVAVIHSIDRQRYYESLRGESDQLLQMYLEAVQTTAVSEIRVYEEAERAPRRRRRA
jgi:Fic family protein